MKRSLVLAIGMVLVFSSLADAQRQRGKNRGQRDGKRQSTQQKQQGAIGDSNPLAIGESGVAWYTTWKSGLTEAKRSNRPIFFMSAATTCSGVSGVF